MTSTTRKLVNFNQRPITGNLLLLIVFIMLATTTLQGCVIVSYHDAKEGRVSLKKSQSKLNKKIEKMKNGNEILAGLFQQSRSRGKDLSSQPFPELKALHDDMLVIQSQLINKQTNLEKLVSNYNSITKGKSDIEESSPLYNKAHKIYKQYEREYKKMAPLAESYNKTSKKFYLTAASNGYELIQVADAIKRLKAYNKNIADRSSEIEKFSREIDRRPVKTGNQSTNSGQAKRDGNLRNQIKELSSNFINAKQHTEQLLTIYSNESRGHKFLWTSPDMEVRKRIAELDREVAMLNDEIKQIKKTWNETN